MTELNIETDIEKRVMGTRGREEKRVRCIKRVTWKFTIPYVN